MINLPWTSEPGEDTDYNYIGPVDSLGIQHTLFGVHSDEAAAFIVRACNSHADLLAALEQCLAIVATQNGNLHDDINKIQDNARTAIAKAKQ